MLNPYNKCLQIIYIHFYYILFYTFCGKKKKKENGGGGCKSVHDQNSLLPITRQFGFNYNYYFNKCFKF